MCFPVANWRGYRVTYSPDEKVFIDAEKPASNPWLLFVVGVGLAVVGIILIARDRRG